MTAGIGSSPPRDPTDGLSGYRKWMDVLKSTFCGHSPVYHFMGSNDISLHDFDADVIKVRVVGGLEPIPAALGQKVGHTLEKSPVHRKVTQRQTTMHTHTHS